MTIHWCGTGLTSAPGLARLLAAEHPVVVWNRSLGNAVEALSQIADLPDYAGTPLPEPREFSLLALSAALRPGDIVVAMLPPVLHPVLARLCLEHGAHLVSSSQIGPAIRAMDDEFRAAGLVSQHESGLDPGLDLVMGHDLVARYRASRVCHPENELTITAYCGGFPKIPTPFRYKFSWAPEGVLRALREPARYIDDFTEKSAAHCWTVLGEFTAPLPYPEGFEAYPHGDSLPMIARLGLDPETRVKGVRFGTLRPRGWAEAWAPIFARLAAMDDLPGPEADAALAALAQELQTSHSYAPGEPDRAVLFVTLKAENAGRTVFHESWILDAAGDARGSAMARLVSTPVALSVEAILAGKVAPGLQSAPGAPESVNNWLSEARRLAQYLDHIDHLA